MSDANDDVLVRLKKSCVFIAGPDGTGTGYLVAPQRIATALHVVKSWSPGQKSPVIVGVGGPTVQAWLLNSDPATDSAVLAFDDAVDAAALPVAGGLRRHVAWEGYGFPALATKSARPAGLPIDGQVKDPKTINDVGQDAVLLYSDAVAAGQASPLHGFSGSPVVVAGALVGHLTKHIGDADDKRRAAYGYVYACPIDAVTALLDVPPARIAIDPPKLDRLADAFPPVAAGEYHVFISYRSTDRGWALSLVARLEGAGLRVFIDQRELAAGEFLAQQLESALQRSRAAVVLVSHGWLASAWCRQEAAVLVKRAVEDPGFRLVPLRLDDCTLPPLLDSRVWLDFAGAPRAEGPNLERLLQAIADRPARPADSAGARADAADVRITDRFVAEIRSAAKGDGARVLEIVGEWRKTASEDLAPLIAAAEVLNGKGLFEATLALLEGAPPTLRVRQLRALALRKIGRVDDAITMLEALRAEGQLDAETGGLLAGSYKARWLGCGDKAFLLLAYEVYRDTWQRTGDAFNGINTAALALYCGDMPRMFQAAGAVRDALLKCDADALGHWDLASLGEANLLLGRFDDAREWYAKAAAKAAGLHQDIAVMRRFARRDLEALGQPRDRLDAVLPVPRVLAYLGHMVDAPDRPQPRLPQAKVGALRRRVQAFLDRCGPVHGFGQASRGTDLIVLEELVRRGLSATVVLPFPEPEFCTISVGGTWNVRLAKLRGERRIEFAPTLRAMLPPPEELAQAFADANAEVMHRAVEYARRLDETPLVLAVWDGCPGDGPGGTADAVALWRDEGYEPEIIDVATL